MTDDLISRQAAIDALNQIFDRCEEIEAHLPDGDPDRTGYKMYPDYMTVWKYLHQLSSAQQEPRWIPCSERLPEKSGRYLVTNTRLGAFEVTWNIFYNGKGEAPEGWLYEDGTIAWMPLPEPYKGEES